MPNVNSGPDPTSQVKPTAMSVSDAARVLSRLSGLVITVEMLEADIRSGAPTNRDGTLNLIHYAAWLAKMSHMGT